MCKMYKTSKKLHLNNFGILNLQFTNLKMPFNSVVDCILVSQTYRNLLYSFFYREFFHLSPQTLGNGNNYEATITSLDIYNARFIRIRSVSGTTKTFCLRIELCGKGKKFFKIKFLLLHL
jgi:hypothetical protein